jgi:signal transduction histidine kinase
VIVDECGKPENRFPATASRAQRDRLATVLLPKFLWELEAETAMEARGKTINIVTSRPEDLAIEADPRLLRSAVTNLLDTPGTGCAFLIDLPSTSPTSTPTA